MKYRKTCTVFKQSLDEQIHIELNSITILFHPCGLLRYCDYFSMISKKVNVDGDEMSWYQLNNDMVFKKIPMVKLPPISGDVLFCGGSVQIIHLWCSSCSLLCCIRCGIFPSDNMYKTKYLNV